MKRLLSVMLCSLTISHALAQSTTEEKDSLEMYRLLHLEALPASVGVEYEMGIANDDIRFNSIWKLAFGDFLDNDDKEEIDANLVDRTRLGYEQHFEAFYEQPTFRGLDGEITEGFRFGIRNDIYTSVAFPKNTGQIFLFGNSRFAGEKVELTGTRYEDWWYTSLDYGFDLTLDSLPINTTVSMVIGHSYSKYEITEAEIFTAQDGEYFDAELVYDLLQTGSGSEQAIKINGMGISTGMSTSFEINDVFSVDVGFSELGFTYWTNLRHTSVDSTFRFKGLVFDNILDINDSVIASERQAITNGFYHQEAAGKLVLMPFHVRVQVNKQKAALRDVKNYYGFVEYRYLTAYIPRLGIGVNFDFAKRNKHLLRTELAFGGFNTLALGAYYTIQLGENFRIGLGSSNILAAMIPTAATGSSIAASVHYLF